MSTINRPSVSELAKPIGYSHVVVSSGTRYVYCAGQVALNSNGGLVGGEDLVAQSQQAIKNLSIALTAANATLADVIKLTFYVVGLNDDSLALIFKGAGAAAHEIGQQLPLAASTVVGIERLAQAGALIEVEAVAALA